MVTGVWPRNQDNTEFSRATVQWVYTVVGELLPLSSGIYGADLGPDPRDVVLADKAFGPNFSLLACLKQRWDPYNVLAYTCLLPKAPAGPKLIILVTGKCGVGKDYCASVLVSEFIKCTHKSHTVRSVSISDLTKRKYTASTGADLNGLLGDRAYKEQHRPALTKFFQDQVRQQPRLPEEHFLERGKKQHWY